MLDPAYSNIDLSDAVVLLIQWHSCCRVTKHFLIGFEACYIEGILCLEMYSFYLGQNPKNREVLSSRGESAIVILLNGHVVKSPRKYFLLYSQTWLALNIGQKFTFAINRSQCRGVELVKVR